MELSILGDLRFEIYHFFKLFRNFCVLGDCRLWEENTRSTNLFLFCFTEENVSSDLDWKSIRFLLLPRCRFLDLPLINSHTNAVDLFLELKKTKSISDLTALDSMCRSCADLGQGSFCNIREHPSTSL